MNEEILGLLKEYDQNDIVTLIVEDTRDKDKWKPIIEKMDNSNKSGACQILKPLDEDYYMVHITIFISDLIENFDMIREIQDGDVMSVHFQDDELSELFD